MLAARPTSLDGRQPRCRGVNSEDVYLEQIVPSDAETAVGVRAGARDAEVFVVDSDGLEISA